MPPPPQLSRKKALYLILLIIVCMVLASRDITHEGAVQVAGDSPKYLMNGVFLLDFLKDLPNSLAHPLKYAFTYFSQYPSLTLGHHPILPALIEVPFYAMFGVSVFSAKLAMAFTYIIGAIYCFQLFKILFDEDTAFLATILYATTPEVCFWMRLPMSEMAAFATIFATLYYFLDYLHHNHKRSFYMMAIFFGLSLNARITNIFLVPIMALYLLMERGTRLVFQKKMITAFLICLILAGPVILVTLKIMTESIHAVAGQSLATRITLENLLFLPRILWKYQLSHPMLILSIISLVVLLVKRQKNILLLLIWIVVCYLFFTYIGWRKPRYSLYWIPPLCTIGVIGLFAISPKKQWQTAAWSILLLLAGYQFAQAYAGYYPTPFSDGYEEMAQYTVAHETGISTLYSGCMDNGMFIFFVRKYDPTRKMIVLRADKLLATSMMDQIIAERIHSVDDIYPLLNEYGVRQVVVAQAPPRCRALGWLDEATKSTHFTLVKTVNLHSTDTTIDATQLNLYEYNDYVEHDAGNAILDLDIPLAHLSITTRIKDLLATR